MFLKKARNKYKCSKASIQIKYDEYAKVHLYNCIDQMYVNKEWYVLKNKHAELRPTPKNCVDIILWKEIEKHAQNPITNMRKPSYSKRTPVGSSKMSKDCSRMT